MPFCGARLGLGGRDASVRFQSIFALGQVGPPAGPWPFSRQRRGRARAPQPGKASSRTLGLIKDPASIDLLRTLVADAATGGPSRPQRSDALAAPTGGGRPRTRLSLTIRPGDASVPRGRAPPLARARILRPATSPAFWSTPPRRSRDAALLSLNARKPPAEIRVRTTALLDDPAPEVRQAAIRNGRRGRADRRRSRADRDRLPGR
ncbi:MAG: hypothetical protein U0790_27065 [Isosphaeraceae bacterium]